jgi:CheY-like chemotaxis protein
MTHPPSTPARILIVEDEVIIAMEIQARLETAGYVICGLETTGEDAILKAREQVPDLILMDISLRGPLNGLEAAVQIQSERDIPVVFISASVDEGALRRIQDVKPGRLITKPFEETDLLTSIRQSLGQ